jgi:hypothetical protein
MFVVTEADAAAIRAVFERGGEFAAAVELRRLFPGITDTAQARACARTIASRNPLSLPVRPARLPHLHPAPSAAAHPARAPRDHLRLAIACHQGSSARAHYAPTVFAVMTSGKAFSRADYTRTKRPTPRPAPPRHIGLRAGCRTRRCGALSGHAARGRRSNPFAHAAELALARSHRPFILGDDHDHSA